jgi:hypothetical protein
MSVSTENNDEKGNDTGSADMTGDEWRHAYYETDKENERLRERIADLERSAASAREIARVAMSHTGTQAVRVELCVRAGQFSLIICDPRGEEYEDKLGARIVELLEASGWKFSSRSQIGSST